MHIRESRHFCLGKVKGSVIVVSMSDLLPCLRDFHTSFARCFAFARRDVDCGDVWPAGTGGGVRICIRSGGGDAIVTWKSFVVDCLFDGETTSRRFEGDIPRRSFRLSKLVIFDNEGIVLLCPFFIAYQYMLGLKGMQKVELHTLISVPGADCAVLVFTRPTLQSSGGRVRGGFGGIRGGSSLRGGNGYRLIRYSCSCRRS